MTPEQWKHKVIPCCPDCGRRMRRGPYGTGGTCRVHQPDRSRAPRYVPRAPGEHDEVDWSTRTNQEAA